VVKISAPEKEERPMVKNGWVLVHDVPLSINLKDYVIARRIDELMDDNASDYP